MVELTTIDDDIDLNRVITKLEIYIVDPEMFEKEHLINGIKANI